MSLSNLLPLLAPLAGLVRVAALITAIRESVKWFSERKSNEIGQAVTSLSEVLTQIRSENQRLIEANDRKDRQLETSEKQIERLENENSKLEILVRSLTQQNMDVAGELRREREERERVHEAHADLMLELGRLRERRERGDHDAA
jgi:chromosome segregation ATPase